MLWGPLLCGMRQCEQNLYYFPVILTHFYEVFILLLWYTSVINISIPNSLLFFVFFYSHWSLVLRHTPPGGGGSRGGNDAVCWQGNHSRVQRNSNYQRSGRSWRPCSIICLPLWWLRMFRTLTTTECCGHLCKITSDKTVLYNSLNKQKSLGTTVRMF